MKTNIRNNKGLYGETIGSIDDRGAVYRESDNKCIGFIDQGYTTGIVGSCLTDLCVFHYPKLGLIIKKGYIEQFGNVLNSSNRIIGSVKGRDIYIFDGFKKYYLAPVIKQIYELERRCY